MAREVKTPNPGGKPKFLTHMVNAVTDVVVTGMVATVTLDPAAHPAAHPAYLRVETRDDGVQLAYLATKALPQALPRCAGCLRPTSGKKGVRRLAPCRCTCRHSALPVGLGLGARVRGRPLLLII